MDTIVIDLETKNTFVEVGATTSAQRNDASRGSFLDKLEISVVGVYSYQKDSYHCYGEEEFSELKKLFADRALLIGFSSNRFDLPLLNRALGLELLKFPRIDLSEEVELKTGRRISLDMLAKANLGVGKNGNSLLAPALYREGKIEELKKYCLNDVKITKELYDLAKKQGFLLVPEKENGECVKVEIVFNELSF